MNGAESERGGGEIRRQRDSHRQIFCLIHCSELAEALSSEQIAPRN